MYAVKGFPSIETSTRPTGSFGRTRMRSPGAFCCAATLQKNAEITMRTRDAPALGLLMRRSSSQNDRLLCVVETDALARLNGGDGHAKGDGVAVASFDVGIGRLAGADRFQPVPDIAHGGVIGAGVGRGLHAASQLGQRESGQKIRLCVHFLCVFFSEPTRGSDLVLVEIERAAVGVVQLLDAAGRVAHARRIDNLEAFGGVIE